MVIHFDGDLIKAAYISGPTHNYLGLALYCSPAADDWPLIAADADTQGNAPQQPASIRAAISDGLRRANAALATQYAVSRAEYLRSDSIQPEIYARLAEAIVRAADAASHCSPQGRA